jgi:zinc-ribbon domain
MAVALRFCGRCGAQVAPGALFCGRCGAPVSAHVAPRPVFSYPMAYPTARQFKLSQVMIAAALLVLLAIVTVVVSALAVSHLAPGSHSACSANCAPKFVSPLPEGATFRSSTFKFQVNYNSRWTVRAQDAGGVTLGTRIGSVQVTGTRGGSAAQALQSAVSALPTGTWQDVTLVSSLKGAHVGDQDGVGAVYSANQIGASSAAVNVRFAVIAASRGGVTVVVFAVDPSDIENSPSGMPEGAEFDYLCTEFVWG